MVQNRRQFLQNSSFAAIGAFSLNDVRNPLVWGTQRSHGASYGRSNEDVDIVYAKTLAVLAMDAAHRAGATYADVRLTRRHIHGLATSQMELHSFADPLEIQEISIGVRALYNGYWGFASSPYWTDEEAVRLAVEAVSQAKINASGTRYEVDLGVVPKISDGVWKSPAQIDPFAVSFDEQADYIRSLLDDIDQLGRIQSVSGALASASWGFEKIEKVCANTEGSLYTQTFGTGHLILSITTGEDVGATSGGGSGFQLPLAFRGWEDFIAPSVRANIPNLIASAENGKRTNGIIKPVEPSRYDTVFDASSVAKILSNTIAQSTELDRALGYESNAEGTSYLDDPLEMLGSFRAGSDLLTVTANRSNPTDLATVKWDDEGVEPDEFHLVDKGILKDFQTTRESAQWLRASYKKAGKTVRSHGCSRSMSAYDIPIQHTPNVVLKPAASKASMHDLIANVKRGVAVFDTSNARARVDQQGKFGYGANFVVREIVNGKLGALLQNAGFLFEATTLWKNLSALGGPESEQALPIGTVKGEPKQHSQYTLRAVPAKFTDVTIVDALRNY